MKRFRTRRRRPKGRGKPKGGKFEREICKKLSLWITNGDKEDCLWRSAISGGRATVAHRKGKEVRQGGDICSVSPEGHQLTDHWFIECKNVQRLYLDQWLIKGTGLFSKFWMKCRNEAKRHGRAPVIIAKQNGWPTLIIGPTDLLLHIKDAAPILSTEYISIWVFDEVVIWPWKIIIDARAIST